MKEPSSRLLRAVIAAALVVSGNAYAAIEGAEDAVDLEGYDVTWTRHRTSLNILGGTGGTGYYGAASTFDDSAYNYDGDEFPVPDVPTCDELLGSAPGGCDVANPPELKANGCGGGPTASIVPDSVVVGFEGYASIAFEGLFTESCNTHDFCYATAGADKLRCDAALPQDMLAAAQAKIPPSTWRVFGSQVIDQINGYDAFFRSSAGSKISMVFFQSAQEESICRAYADSVLQYCRVHQ